ncbi:putative S-adenosyl-L-methionine-dependent methyltransferase YktD [Polycladomyces abyssicola]|uniref:S-adenosyl-L-methionine-dependent methyltransferase n=1 Tax=Polycladomyces abyssicola TaxID=1125966 RepID=A0A8D5UG54_9BACL|nr:class I SAM-dependent methyltransferase [Polycladomyces abyssicola]BCU81654.1 putative S-adenosyl-L-methionine-dependent methyltransferase YktD [Polycladomyces abyssicola]
MEENQVSLTALISAYARAYHAMYDSPKIFNDFLAYHLFTDEEFTNMGRNLAGALKFFDPERAASCPDQETALAWVMRTQSTPITLSRARYTEDSLETAVKQGVQQYVILGAGMDTFAFRRPEMLRQLQVFEVDHPATQALKRHRLSRLGWEYPAQLHFVPVDFTKESLVTALKRSSYDQHTLSFFSWLGVTYYLTRDVVFDTLRSLTDIAPVGSTIIFDYLDTDAFVPERAAKRVQRMQEIVRRAGEPMKTGFDPSTLAADLASIGLHLHENLGPSDIEARYFQGRTDGYHAFEHVHFAWAVIA